MAIILLACGPCVVIVNCWDRLCTLGRAPRTKETFPDFHEWYRVTRHPRIFRGLTSCQRTPGFGASQLRMPNRSRPMFMMIFGRHGMMDSIRLST